MTLAEDTILENRYRIDTILAQGRRSTTYRGFDTNLSMPVVIKEVALSTGEAINQFKQQALILTGIRHRALPWVIHHFSLEDRQYLVMDFVAGKNMEEFIEERATPLPERQALEVIIQISQGVSHLHQQSVPIIHGDIKPKNIKFDPNDQAVLVDIGIFEADAPSSLEIQTTPSGFLAPELYHHRTITPQSDLYALGATLYALVTGQTPLPRLKESSVTSPEALNPQLSPLLVKAIAGAMQFDPGDRPASVLSWQKELEYILKAGNNSMAVQAGASPSTSAESSSSAPDFAQPAPIPIKFWLVDPKGLGYPISEETVVIGSSPETDVRLDHSEVSWLHAEVRLDDSRCSVRDMGSANGTFLNGHRLSVGWYPFNTGDILEIGPTRFHITTVQPVRTASLRTKPELPSSPILPAHEEVKKPATDKTTGSPPPRKRNSWLVAGLALVVLIIGGSLVLWSGDNPVDPSPEQVPATEEQAIVAEIRPSETLPPTVTQIESEDEEILPLQPASTPRPAQTLTPTEIPATVTASSSLTESISPPTPRPSSPTPANALTLSGPLTLSVTVVAGVSPTPAGPTPIPVQSNEQIAEIGVREVTDVDINRENPGEVYALIKRDGIYKSSNGGGGPWLKLPVDATSVVAFVIDPTNPARFYAATWNAVLKSSDGGNSWLALSNGLQANKTVDIVTVDPHNPETLYAGIGENLVVSKDGGQSWISGDYGQGLGVSRLFSIVVDPFDSNTIYVAGLAGSIYKSTNGGNNFVQLPDNIGQGAYSLVAHPTQPNIYLAGLNSAQAAVIKTENGQTFRPVSSGLVYGGADSPYNAIAYAPSHPNIVYAGSGYESNLQAKGIFKSTDGGETWASISTGLPRNPETGQPYYVKSIAVHPGQPDTVLVATGSGLYYSADGGENWVLK